jgi:hypothetical protein
MKTYLKLLAAITLPAMAFASSALAQLNVPSDGSDGALIITTNTVIDLSQAVSGVWSANNSAASGQGIYDSNQWAVVFKYSCVNITNGATLTFANHPTHAPVVWLVESNVTINGTVSVNGQPGNSAIPNEYTPTEPGPGGFRGGANGPLGAGDGYGLGGGSAYGSADGEYASVYGNPQILPLIGGSGSGVNVGYDHATIGSGGGAGGAILIVSGGSMTINGSITADGGTESTVAGSAGAIRLVANQILGIGTIDASSPTPGRTRIEANYASPTLNIFPNAAAVPPGITPVVWPPANAPTVAVISVDSQSAPANPLATVTTSSDVTIQNNSPVVILLQTQNFPIQGAVSLRILPKYGSAQTLAATYISGNVNSAIWAVTNTLPQAYCTLQARATAP